MYFHRVNQFAIYTINTNVLHSVLKHLNSHKAAGGIGVQFKICCRANFIYGSSVSIIFSKGGNHANKRPGAIIKSPFRIIGNLNTKSNVIYRKRVTIRKKNIITIRTQLEKSMKSGFHKSLVAPYNEIRVRLDYSIGKNELSRITNPIA